MPVRPVPACTSARCLVPGARRPVHVCPVPGVAVPGVAVPGVAVVGPHPTSARRRDNRGPMAPVVVALRHPPPLQPVFGRVGGAVCGDTYRRVAALRAGARLVAFLAAVLRAGARLAAVLRAGARLAAVLRAGARLVAFLAAVFRAGARLAAFLAAVLRAGARLAVVLRTAFFTALFAVVFFALAFLTAFLTAFLAAVLLAVALRAAVFRAGAFLAVLFRAAVFRAGAFLAVAFFFVAALFTAMGAPSLGFNADLNVEPVANRTPFDAGIGTTAPVRGFLPIRAARPIGLNDPNPTTDTFRPERTSAMIVSNKTSTTSSTTRRLCDVDALTDPTSCDLFTNISSAIRNR